METKEDPAIKVKYSSQLILETLPEEMAQQIVHRVRSWTNVE